MNRFVAFITGVHVLLHSIFGCCNHASAAHLHDVDTLQRCHDETRLTDAISGSHCNEQAADSCSGDDERQCGCDTSISADDCFESTDEQHHCRHASCDWLTTIEGPAISPVDCGCSFVPATFDPSATVPQSVCLFSDSTVFGRFHPLPVRLHLAVGVLLI
jgi:hypothetical protein